MGQAYSNLGCEELVNRSCKCHRHTIELSITPTKAKGGKTEMTRITVFNNAMVEVKYNTDGTFTSTIGEYSNTAETEFQATVGAWLMSVRDS